MQRPRSDVYQLLRGGVAVPLCGLALFVCTAEARAQVETVHELYPKSLSFDLTVTRVEQSQLLEHSPVQVRYRLTVSTAGIVGPDPGPTSARVCPSLMWPQHACVELPSVVSGKTYSGQLTAFTSFAGARSGITLVVQTPPPENGAEFAPWVTQDEATVLTPVAARYEIAITGFDVQTSRSTYIDTQWLLLQGMVKTDPPLPPHPSMREDACFLQGFNWCTPLKKLGDNGDGVHAVTVSRVGPYYLVPEQESELRFLYYLDNIGDNPAQEIGLGVANGFSKAGMVILGAFSAAQGSSQGGAFATTLDGVMEQFHSTAFASCDGKLADEIVVLPNKTLIPNQPELTLEARTHATGQLVVTSPSPTDAFRNKDGDFRCDRRGGQYRVTYTIDRTSWQPDVAFRSARVRHPTPVQLVRPPRHLVDQITMPDQPRIDSLKMTMPAKRRIDSPEMMAKPRIP